MKGRRNNLGSRYFRWGIETRLVLMETVAMVEEELEYKRHGAGKVMQRASGCGLVLPHKKKWEEVASRLPPAFDTIDHSKLGSTCHSQFIKLQQRLKSMIRDRHDRYRTAAGKRDRLMTDELCRKIVEYQTTFCKGQARRKDNVPRTIHDKRTPKQLTSTRDLARTHPLQKALREGGHTSVSNVHQQSTIRPKALLAAGKSLDLYGGVPIGVNQPLSLCTVPEHPRSGVFRWSEAARLQVIQAVKMMDNNLTEAGQIRSWKDLAAGLPLGLFWDIEVDRLASIAQKQFSEMKRRYRILKDSERPGHRPITFKTMTKKVVRELETYEERGHTLQRWPQIEPSHCGSNAQDRLWITKRPAQARHDLVEVSSARGAVLVETFPSFIEKELSDPLDGNSVFPACGVDPSDCGKSTDDGPTATSDSIHSAEDGNGEFHRREAMERKAAAPAQTLTGRESKEAPFSSFQGAESEEGLDEVRNRRTVPSRSASEAADSGPDHEIDTQRDVVKRLSGRHRGYSSAASCRHDPSPQGGFSNKPNVISDRAQKRFRRSFVIEDDGQNPSNSLRDENSHGGEGFLPSAADDPGHHSEFGSQTGYDWSSDDSEMERSLHDNSGENQQRLKSAARNCSKGSDPGTVGVDDENNVSSPGNPRNGRLVKIPQSDDDQQPEEFYGPQADPDSVTTGYQLSSSQGGQNSDAAADSCHSKSEDFVQGESQFRKGRSMERFQRTSGSSADPSHSNEGVLQSHDDGQRHRSDNFNQDSCPPRNRARTNHGGLKMSKTIPALRTKSKVTKGSGPGQPDETSEGSPVLHETLTELDLEFSKLNRWLKHHLFPTEMEKIKNAIRSEACIPSALIRETLPESGSGEVASKSRRKRIRWVLKSTFQQVRIKLVEVVDKTGQVVIQELLQSYKVSKT